MGSKIKEEIPRYLVMLPAFAIMSLGLVLALKARLGTPPWDVFHLGLALQVEATFGQAILIVGISLILISFLMGVKPHISTFLNMISMGLYIDLFITYNLIPQTESMVVRALQLLAGTFAFAFGTALYIALNRGAGPRDSFMVAIIRKTGLRVGLVRTIIEVTVTFLGFLMGGPVGAGTLFFALTVGYFLELSLKIIRKQSKLFRKYEAEKRGLGV